MTWSSQGSVATTSTSHSIPPASAFARSPLRNRIRVHLDTSVSELWKLVGDHGRLPEYSSGIGSAEVFSDASGDVRVCHFRPAPGVPEGTSIREHIRWFAPERGYAATSEPGNVFGLEDDVSLVTVEPAGDGAFFTWDQHYQGADVDFLRASFDEGLLDMAEQLIRRFGGVLVERYVDR